jgi:hypothetical protein
MQRHQNGSVFRPIVISQLEFPFGELRISPDADEQAAMLMSGKLVMRPLWTFAASAG